MLHTIPYFNNDLTCKTNYPMSKLTLFAETKRIGSYSGFSQMANIGLFKNKQLFFCNRLTNGCNKNANSKFGKTKRSSNDYLADVKRVVCSRQGLTTNLSGSG